MTMIEDLTTVLTIVLDQAPCGEQEAHRPARVVCLVLSDQPVSNQQWDEQ